MTFLETCHLLSPRSYYLIILFYLLGGLYLHIEKQLALTKLINSESGKTSLFYLLFQLSYINIRHTMALVLRFTPNQIAFTSPPRNKEHLDPDS